LPCPDGPTRPAPPHRSEDRSRGDFRPGRCGGVALRTTVPGGCARTYVAVSTGLWPLLGAGVCPDREGQVVLNVGSSPLKAALRDPHLRMHVAITELDGEAGRMTVTGTRGPVEHADVSGGWKSALDAVAHAVTGRALPPQIVAHRIVHGSPTLVAAELARDRVLEQLRAEAQLDPLHLPRQLDVLEEARALWPDADVVLVPDDLFHRSLPDEAVALPLPADARATGLRRWGFHGLAVQSVVDQLPGMGCGVVVHLGSGCSVTAVQGGASRFTSMSLSPAGGIPSVTGAATWTRKSSCGSST
jgi:acetate kinase